MNLVPGDTVIVDLGNSPFGHEQAGARPAIFVSRSENLCLLVPITSNLRTSRFVATYLLKHDNKNSLDVDSVALVYQLRSVDVRRIIAVIGRLHPKDIREINRILRSIASISP